jgi:prepilin-type N-terminal cleavage/methylation domain-containing protein
MWSNRQRGFTLLEAVVAMTVFTIGLLGAAQMTLTAERLSSESKDTVQAANYLEEGLEAVRSVRDSSWTDIATDGTYHLASDTEAITPWQLVLGGTETIGKFTRTVEISNVRRADTDGDGQLSAGDDIVQSGGAFDDPDTKRVKAVVSWQQGARTVTRSVATYLTNWQQ